MEKDNPLEQVPGENGSVVPVQPPIEGETAEKPQEALEEKSSEEKQGAGEESSQIPPATPISIPAQAAKQEEAAKPEETAEQEVVKPARRRSAAKKKAASLEAAGQTQETRPVGTERKHWYVVHTLSGQENKVKENLESRLQVEEMTELVTQILIPTENVSEVKSGKKTVTTRKFFPGYVLVNMTLNEKSWYFIRNTSGVIGFIGTGKPVPLQDHEVREILEQIEEKKEKVKPKVMFDVGENVKVNDGPFVNFTGTVEEVNPDRGKLKVMVSIFGRVTPIELEYWQVERS